MRFRTKTTTISLLILGRLAPPTSWAGFVDENFACTTTPFRSAIVVSSRVILFLFLTVFLGSPFAWAQTCAANIPHVDGVWRTLPYLMPINPISATLLLNGRVLIVSGSENDASNNSPGSESYRSAVWDPTGTDESSVGVQHLNYDVFCSGTAVLADGRPLIVGGTATYSFTGDN